MPKRLIINADDYGHCPEINLAVEELASAGRLGGVSLLANGNCWEEAVYFLQSHPQVSAGVHLNAVEGKPVSHSAKIEILTDGDKSFVGLPVLLKRCLLHPVQVSTAIEIEWRAQIERLIGAGANLIHADSHRHLHAFPLAYGCLVKLCREYKIPAHRWPAENGARKKRFAGSVALKSALTVSGLAVPSSGLFRNNQILGFARAGVYGLADLANDLAHLAEGVTELVVHPSMLDGHPYAALRGNRERAALLDSTLPRTICQMGIEVTSWERVTQVIHAN